MGSPEAGLIGFHGRHPVQAQSRNALLGALPPSSLAALAPFLQPVQLPNGFIIARPNHLISDVYFPEQGVASMILSAPSGEQVETGLVGREGVVPLSGLFGGERTSASVIMQIAGVGQRISVLALSRVANQDRDLAVLLIRYLQASSVQIAHTVLANAVGNIEARLARWLLMCHDRVGAPDLALTHEFLSIMLAVRRAGITEALHELESAHLIKSRRSLVTIVDRARLEQLAAGLYGQAEAEHRRIMGLP